MKKEKTEKSSLMDTIISLYGSKKKGIEACKEHIYNQCDYIKRHSEGLTDDKLMFIMSELSLIIDTLDLPCDRRIDY